MKGKILNKFGPYQGPYEKIITYKILINNKIYTWHENGNRGLNAKIGDILLGFELIGDSFNYKTSNPINTQMTLF